MTKEQYDIISKAFINFFSCDSGNVWTNPDIANPLEDFLFEDLGDWEAQKLVESKLKYILNNEFSALNFDHDKTEFILDTKNRDLQIRLVAALKDSGDYEVFTINPGLFNQ